MGDVRLRVGRWVGRCGKAEGLRRLDEAGEVLALDKTMGDDYISTHCMIDEPACYSLDGYN